jgi:hypothetical protein
MAPLPVWLDCSPEAQAERLRLLADLQAKLASGVYQISDRGRSVSYRSAGDISNEIYRLKNEAVACATGVWGGPSRLAYIDQIKGL